MLDLKKLLTKMLQRLAAHDTSYITAESNYVADNDGPVWRCRKWSSGRIEAWTNITASARSGSVWTSPIYYSDMAIKLPDGMFRSAPDNIQLTNANAQWVTLGTNAVTASGFNVRLIKPTSGSQAVAFDVYAVKY